MVIKECQMSKTEEKVLVMQLPLFRRNVVKAAPIKQAKAGYRYTARNTVRSNVLTGAVKLAEHVGQTVNVSEKYLLEGRMSDQDKHAIRVQLGHVGYWLVFLAKNLKVKLPGAGKKIKLVGTQGKAILDLSNLSTSILAQAAHALKGPVTKEEKVKRKVKGVEVDGVKHVIVPAKQAEAEQKINSQIVTELTAFADTYYRLVYALFALPPAALFAETIHHLSMAHPKGFFTFVVEPKPKTDKKAGPALKVPPKVKKAAAAAQQAAA